MNTPSSPQVGDRITPHRSCPPCPVLCLKVMAPRLLPGSSLVPEPGVWTAALPSHGAVGSQPPPNMQPRQDPFQDCNPVCLGTVSGFQVLAPAFCWHTLSTGGEAIPWDQVPCTLDSQDTCAQLLLPWGCARAVFHEEPAASRTVLCALCSSGEISG